MGTRNVTFVAKGGEIKVAQYGQWDGYPSGNGIVILEFLRNNPDLSKLAANVDNAVIPTEEQKRGFLIEAGMDPKNDDGWVTSDISDRFENAHPSLSRDMGAKVLEYVNETEVPELSLDTDFVTDGLYCEWAYLVDLDANTLEVYCGYDVKPLSEENRFGDDAIVLVQKFPLNDLPDNEKFLEILEPNDD